MKELSLLLSTLQDRNNKRKQKGLQPEVITLGKLIEIISNVVVKPELS